MFNDSLKRLWGLHPMQEAYFDTLRELNNLLVPARIIFSSHDQYKVLILGMYEEKHARARGHLYHQGEELPAVGDWVAIELSPGDHQFLPIESTLPRISELKRSDGQRGYQTLIANIDYIGLVTSFNQDLNLRRLERGLAMVNESKATPLIIVNKSDLLEKPLADERLKELSQRFRGVAVITCSAQNGQGIAQIKDLFEEGTSVAFLGMSGVGKSTLINAILGTDQLTTNEIRTSDSRGRHTTTHREIFLTEQGFWIIDNPGIREFSFYGEESDLENTFEDVASIMTSCRFGNCSHSGESGCRIAQAIETGELSADRWENFLKIKREMAFQANKNNKSYHSMKRKEYAKRSMDLRKILKSKGRM